MDKYFFVERSSGLPVAKGESTCRLGRRGSPAFFEWSWDGRKLEAANDRYGIYPAYYFSTEDRFAISPSIDLLVRLTGATEFDDDSFAVALRLGSNLGNDTMFRHIKALPPDSTLVWENGALSISSKPRPRFTPMLITRADAIMEYARRFRRSIESTMPMSGTTAIPLSGGRDSRHILFERLRMGPPPDACLTIRRPPPAGNEDVRIAKLICEKVGVPHHEIAPQFDRFVAEKEKNVETGYSVQEHGWFVGLARFVGDRWDTVYDGLAGDVLSAGLYLDPDRLRWFRDGDLTSLAESILGPEGYIPLILSSGSLSRFSRERASARLQIELAQHTDLPNPVASFYFWNRTRRCVALSPFRLLKSVPNVVTPYLEPDLFDFLSSLPAEMMLDHSFHTETIAYAYPEYSDIPYENKRQGHLQRRDGASFGHNELCRLALSPRQQPVTRRSFFVSRWLLGRVSGSVRTSFDSFLEIATGLLQLERL